MVPPCRELEPEPDFLPPRLEAPGELAIRAARSFDMLEKKSAKRKRGFRQAERVDKADVREVKRLLGR